MPISGLAREYGLVPKTLEHQYREHISDFCEWKELINEDALIYPENFGKRMQIDETMLADGELYTILTNANAKGKKGALAALIKGTKQSIITKALLVVPLSKRLAVTELTLDMAETMHGIGLESFPNAVQVIDRFHVQKEVAEGVQDLRIRYRKEAIKRENAAAAEAKRKRETYAPKRFENDDTEKELLARSRYILMMKPNERTATQEARAQILFQKFPDIEKAYKLGLEFRNIYETKDTPENMRPRFRAWYEKVSKSEIEDLMSAACTVERHETRILNYFNHRSTNAGAESFNAKLKGFRALVRGVRDKKFFFYRVTKLYA